MAARTFLLKDASSTGYGTLTEATATAQTMGSGWTVGTSTANSFSTMLYGTTRAANTFTTGTDQLATQANFATGQAWRTDNPIDGTFSSATNWTFNTVLLAVSTAASQQVRLKARLWKSSDPVGATANQTQLTIATAAGFLTGTTSAALTKTTGSTSTFTWTPTGIAAFNNEYLFVSMECNTVVAGGRAGADAIFVATANSNVITSNFTPATTLVTGAESLSLTDAATARFSKSRSTVSESLSVADTATRIRFTRSTGTESLSISDSQSAKKIFTPIFVTEVLSPVDTQSTPSAFTPKYARNYYAFSPTQLFVRFGFKQIGAVSAVHSVKETLSLVDTQSRARTTKATAAESIIPLDTQSAIYSTRVTAAESITPVDSQSAIKRTLSTQSESLTLVDAQSARTRTLVTGAETISLVDTQLATAVRPATASNIQESLILVDTQTARTRTQLFLTETISPADTQSTIRTTKATAAETISLVDTQAGSRTTKATAAESISLTDTQTRARFAPVSDSESISLTDSQTTKARFGTTQTETISLLDSQSAIERTSVTVSESISLVDVTNATAVGFGVSQCRETISLQDSQDATLISGQRVDTHDGVGKKKKKKKRLDFSEEINRRERIRKQIQDVIHPPVITKLPPEEPEAAPVEAKPTRPLKPIAPAVDYAGLARDEIVAKIRSEAELRAKETELKIKEKQRILELKRLEEQREEDELEMILMELL